jgi:hypothetical protein
MNWGLFLMAALWAAFGVSMLLRPKENEAISKRLEKLRSAIPLPLPRLILPIWVVRLLGVVTLSVSALMFYLSLRTPS